MTEGEVAPVTDADQGARPALHAPRRSVSPPRLFASGPGEQRLRRPLDAATAALAVVLLAVFAAWAQPTRPFELSLTDAVTSWPDWLNTLWVLTSDVLPLVAAGALIATVVRRRWPLLIQCVLSGAGAVALVIFAARFGTGDWESLQTTLGLSDTVAWPAAVITISSAVLLALAADVTIPARSTGEWVIGIAAVTSVLAGRATPTGVIAGLLAAIAAAAVARLLVGTAAGRVSKEDALALLDAVGVTEVEIEQFSRQSDGVVLVEVKSGNDRLLAKVLGRDVSEQRRMLRLWRSLMYRDNAAALASARVPGLERETLATLLADVHGVPVWRVLTVGSHESSDQLLVLITEGARASSLTSESFDAAFAASAWQTLNAFHTARFAHLAITPRSLAVRGDGTVALTDFTDAVGAAEVDQIHTDDAQLLVCLAALAGSEIAIASAREALSSEELEAVLPFMQSAALPRDLRVAAKAGGVNVDALRKATAEAAGVDAPDLAKLRRVTLGSIFQAVLLVLAASAITTYFSGLDIDELREAFQSASIALLVTGFVISQLPRLTQAISTLGSVPARLPYVPVYMMQLATGFMNIALPSAAARTVLSIRFFQRQGIAPATAAVSGVVDAFMGNVVQAILLGSLLLFGETSLDIETGGSTSSDDGKHTLLYVVAIALVVAVVALLFSDRLRKKVVGKARSWWPDIKAAAATLRNPRKLTELFVGNIATELLFASALAVFVHAFGGDISLVEALFVNLAASLLVMFIPIPGGIGVSEGALVVGLTGIGISQDVAFAAVISYRVSTFYLPPVWGWLAMRWMEKRSYI
jgi:uncharacterized membrane protein YbhN (UPF0104 family)